MKGPDAFRRTGRGTWAYQGFQVDRRKSARSTSRAQVYRTDAALGGEAITLSAPSLSELKWETDRLVDDGGVPSGPGTAESRGN